MNIRNFRGLVMAAVFASSTFIAVPAVYAADNSDAPINKREASAILEELKKIRATLERIEKQGKAGAQRPAAPTVAKVSSKDRPTLGKKNAPVTIVEYSDYQCPFCKRFADNTMPQLKKEYIDTGKVKLVFKDMPLGFHKFARKAAQAAHCAGEQGKYWEMHDELFKNTRQLQEENLPKYAGNIKLNINKFKSCLASDRFMAQIDRDMAEAQKARITGTPTFVIGKSTKDVINGDVVRGAQPFNSLKIIIEKQLK